MSDIELLKLYKEFGVDEIISDNPINRFENMENRIDNIIKKPEDDITESYSKMTESQAISQLAKKQSGKSMKDTQNITPISQIVEEVKSQVENIENLSDLEKAVREFDGCSLKRMATNTVFADGDPKSQIMIIGEAPGNHEDLQGIPFCGDSGKLLNEMFSAINLPREKLYITNTLFWRPPGNRRPTEDELAMCRPFVEKHIALISPKIIVLMGATAMFNMLGITDPISKVRGKFINYNNKYLSKEIPSITLFHPSYLLRQSNKKRVAWKDLLTIDSFLNSSLN